jgi:hypothetical protein
MILDAERMLADEFFFQMHLDTFDRSHRSQ